MAMPKFRFNKLIRDNMPELFAKSNQTVEYKTLTEEELRQAMIDKLIEEVKELRRSFEKSKDEIAEELSDLQQLIDDIRAESGITQEELSKLKNSKKLEKGGFRKGIYAKTIQLQDDDKKWVKYYRSRPIQYPEIFISNPTKKFLAGLVGGFMLLAGIIMVPYPGPGWVVVFIGLTILAREFQWARDIYQRLRDFYDAWRRWMAIQKPWVQAIFWLLTAVITVMTIWLINGYGLMNSWFNLGQDWLVSPLFR